MSTKLEIDLASWIPGLIVDGDPRILAVKVVIDTAVAEEGCLMAPLVLVLTLTSRMGANHIPQGSSALPDQHDNGQYLGLSGSPDSHAPGSQPPSRAAILVHFPSCEQGQGLQLRLSAPLNLPASAKTV